MQSAGTSLCLSGPHRVDAEEEEKAHTELETALRHVSHRTNRTDPRVQRQTSL